MKVRRLWIYLFVFFVIFVYTFRECAPIADVRMKAQAEKVELSLEQDASKIVVFTDDVDPSCGVLADNLFAVLKSYYPQTEKIVVGSFAELQADSEAQYFIRIYVFYGSLNGLSIGYDSVSWSDFGRFLNEYTNNTMFGPTAHVLATGDGGLLKQYLGSYPGFKVEANDVSDVKLCFLYDVLTVADVLHQKGAYRLNGMVSAGQNLFNFGLKYLQENSNETFSRALQPVDVLGQPVPSIDADPSLVITPVMTRMYPTATTPPSEKPVLFMGTTEQSSEGSLNWSSWDSNYYPFINMTLKSGANGPIGKILDGLLKEFADYFKIPDPPTLGISKDFLNAVEGYLENMLLSLNGTVLNWFKSNMPWLFSENQGKTAPQAFSEMQQSNPLSGLLDQAGQGSGAARLMDLWNSITGDCIQNVGEFLGNMNDWISKKLHLNYTVIDYPVSLGSFNLFHFNFSIDFFPEVSVDNKSLVELLNRTLFNPNISDFSSAFSASARNYEDVLSAVKIEPTLNSTLGISSFSANSTTPDGSDDSESITQKLFNWLGVKLNFTGSGSFSMQLMKVSLKDSASIEFFKIREWSFKFDLKATYTINLLDYIGGLGDVVSSINTYVGTNITANVDFTLGIDVEIIKESADAGKNETSNMLLTISIGASCDFNLLIVELQGGFDIILKFSQDFAADTPLEIRLIVDVWLKCKIDLVLWCPSFGGSWTLLNWTISGGHKSSPQFAGNSSQSSAESSGSGDEYALGRDSDHDGLSDDFENKMGLNPYDPDTDHDGLSDKFELEVSHTDPKNPDTDGDGLTDYQEFFIYHTDPLRKDTDYDGLNDGDEVFKYHTSPINPDTDGDGLSDGYEVNITYDYTGTNVTASVPYVIINGTKYYNHTDPLNPDTDGDGLLDGQEGYRIGPYYGHVPGGRDPSLFNFGYTHPLAYDTDMDSYMQYANGTVVEPKYFYRDMNDGIEVKGQLINFVNTTTGGPMPKVVHTNPCDPDTDNDTGGGIFSNSDGRELSLNPPTDPTNNDTDSDGIVDGQEGTSDQYVSYHTDPNNPDTDHDGLPDGLEIKLGTNPLVADTDGDGVTDGDEYFKYHTNPLCNDTDHDGLLDGEEIFQFHSDPLLADSDNDTIPDGLEVHVYGTDPINPDTDGDHLNDNIELFVLHTNPLSKDTDGDGISDWDEVNIYHTNPLSWDTDNDSITTLNSSGQMTLRLGDYEEIFIYHTNPLSSDTDQDGMPDAQEICLAKGLNGYTTIPLNPLCNDTDGDGLLDGQELRVTMNSTFWGPDAARCLEYPYGSSPINNDTDGDGLSDGYEVLVSRTNPNSSDSDHDGLTDPQEIFIYHTSPINNDTDGDYLTDWQEIFVYHTDPLNNDTDHDGIADGLEVIGAQQSSYPSISQGSTHGSLAAKSGLRYDPLNNDTDGDGVKDGMELDYDHDGLKDAEEFYVYHTCDHTYFSENPVSGSYNFTDIVGHPAYLVIGGVNNTDSDGDGLTDGNEVHVYHLSPTNPETFGNGISDKELVLENRTGQVYIFAYDNATQRYVNASCLIQWPNGTSSTVWTNNETGFSILGGISGDYNITSTYLSVQASNSPQTFTLGNGVIENITFGFTSASPLGQVYIFAYDNATQRYVNASCLIQWPNGTSSTVWTNNETGYSIQSGMNGDYNITSTYIGMPASNNPQIFTLENGMVKNITFEFKPVIPEYTPNMSLPLAVFFAATLLFTAVPVMSNRKPKRRSRPNESLTQETA